MRVHLAAPPDRVPGTCSGITIPTPGTCSGITAPPPGTCSGIVVGGTRGHLRSQAPLVGF